jgi:hypothetical protein
MPKKKPLGVYAVEKIGFRRAMTALTYVVSWGLASDAEGRALTVEEHAAYWKQSRATSYRERDAFVLLFPDEKTPEKIWATARASVTSKRPDVAVTQVMGVQL